MGSALYLHHYPGYVDTDDILKIYPVGVQFKKELHFAEYVHFEVFVQLIWLSDGHCGTRIPVNEEYKVTGC